MRLQSNCLVFFFRFFLGFFRFSFLKFYIFSSIRKLAFLIALGANFSDIAILRYYKRKSANNSNRLRKMKYI